MRKVVFLAALAAIGTTLTLAGPKPPKPKPLPTITVCGHLTEGVECMLFQADDGRLFIVDTSAFPPGDCFCVTGKYDRDCLSYCQQGVGCIFNITVTPCP